MSVAVVFPGQGTQRPGMGKPWLGHGAWRIVERAEVATDRRLGWLLLNADESDLSRTAEAQFAVFLSSLVAWEGCRGALDEPVAFAGHSLGQITALVAAGALEVEEGARLVAVRAEATQHAADERPGRMAALLGAHLDQAEAACGSGDDCWIANDNAPGQVVIGGTVEGVEAAVQRAGELGVRKALTLDVGGAFHTPLMEPASIALGEYLKSVEFSRPVAPIVHNSDGALHADDSWADRLTEHLIRPVRWRESLEVLAALRPDTLVEVGASSTLSAMARRTVPTLATCTIDRPESIPSAAVGP